MCNSWGNNELRYTGAWLVHAPCRYAYMVDSRKLPSGREGPTCFAPVVAVWACCCYCRCCCRCSCMLLLHHRLGYRHRHHWHCHKKNQNIWTTQPASLVVENEKLRKLRQASLPSELRKTKGMKVRTYISMVQQTMQQGQLDEFDPKGKQLVSSVNEGQMNSKRNES